MKNTHQRSLSRKLAELLREETQGADLPEAGRLPSKGYDRFGFSRSAYYLLEKNGCIRLIRVRQPGHQLGTVLVDYTSVREYLAKLSAEQNSERVKPDCAPALLKNGGRKI